MGLNLVIVDGDDEIDSVEVGQYSDFSMFRTTIAERLEGGKFGSRFPTLMLHSDCDGSWTPDECRRLERELETIGGELRALPPVALPGSGWQRSVQLELGLQFESLYDCFFDVNGEPLIDRLLQLARTSKQLGLPIDFQ